jgi:hypothetical protein
MVTTFREVCRHKSNGLAYFAGGLMIGYWDLDFFIFCHCFLSMSLKFPKFERDQNATKEFQIGINESAKLRNSMKVD